MNVLKGWKTYKIGELFLSSNPGDWGREGTPENGVPVLRSTNFRNDGYIDFTDLVFREIDNARLEKRQVKQGSILIEKSGGSPTQAAGRVVYCDRDFGGTASNFIEILQTKSDFFSQYVALLLFYLYQTGLVLKYQQQTTGIINFKLCQYVDELVSLPVDKKEQTKIAEVLSTLDRAIEQTEALIAKQQRIKTGLMQDLLTKGIDENGNIRSEATHAFKDSPLGRIPMEWDSVKTSDVCQLITKGTTPKFRGAESNEYAVPFLRVQNLSIDGRLDLSVGLEFIAQSVHFGDLRRSVVYPGDVLQNIVGPPLGKVAIASRQYDNWNINQAIALFRPNARISSEYLGLWLTTDFVREWFDLNSKKTSGQQNLTFEHCRDLPIVIPLPTEQQSICRFINLLEATTQNYKAELDLARCLKMGLMHDLLTGNRRVTPLLEQATPQ